MADVREETVTIGCRLPSGYKLEVGYEVVAKAGNGMITQFRRIEGKYRTCTLKGTHEHTREQRMNNIQVPSMLRPKPFINKGVSKALWEEWKRLHANSPLLANKTLFEVTQKDDASVGAATLDAMATETPFAPVDPSVQMKVGNNKIEKLDLNE
jgi:hypothetical protein